MSDQFTAPASTESSASAPSSASTTSTPPTAQSAQAMLEAHLQSLVGELTEKAKADLSQIVEDAKSVVANHSSDVDAVLEELGKLKDGAAAKIEAAVADTSSRLGALVSELEKGGIVSRLHSLELAVASLGAPMVSQVEHDAQGLFQKWYTEIKDHFFRQVPPSEPPPGK